MLINVKDTYNSNCGLSVCESEENCLHTRCCAVVPFCVQALYRSSNPLVPRCFAGCSFTGGCGDGTYTLYACCWRSGGLNSRCWAWSDRSLNVCFIRSNRSIGLKHPMRVACSWLAHSLRVWGWHIYTVCLLLALWGPPCKVLGMV